MLSKLCSIALKSSQYNMPRQASCYRVLNVAEKNDAAKRISDILSGHQYQRLEGFSKFNKIYEFDYHILGQQCHMVMTSLSGHLLNYEFVGCYRKWTSCHPIALFDAKVEKCVTENMMNIKRTLEKEVRLCQALIIWTDCDREGENIGFEIIDICKNIKPNISIYRARFSEITERSVSDACRNLVAPDRRVSEAVDTRQELDLRIGAAFTRFQTLRLQKTFPQVLSNKVISYGSCQFPTLGFVVERYKAREQFQSEVFWKIEVTHSQVSPDSPTAVTSSFNWKRNRLFEELPCKVLYENCIEAPAVATVTDVNSRPRSRWRPVAMETVELEKLCSRKLRISAKETMKIAEKLYVQGFISYPRTETNIFPKDFDLNMLVREQVQHPSWGGFAQRLLEMEGGPTPRNGRSSDKAHPPIHPTKFTSSLMGNEARVYELITRHFLACCHRDAQGHETTVEIELGGEKFSAQGLMIIARNYLEVYPYDKWNAKVIPVYNIGDEFEPTSITMTQGSTSPPPLLTEADLIALMDKHGIGTDATHAEHIEKIKQRLYVGLTNDQKFVPGELGMGLVEGYNNIGHEMSRPELRAELESDLRKICDGEANKQEVLERHISKYRAVFREADNQSKRLDEALAVYFGASVEVANNDVLNPSEASAPLRPCPNCGKDMIIKRKKDKGFMVSCVGFPECKTAAFFPNSVISLEVDDSVCSVCHPHPVHRVRLKVKRGSVPPYFDPDQIKCISGCDQDVVNILGIRWKCDDGISSTSQQRLPRSSSNSHVPGGGPGILRTSSAQGRCVSRGGSTKRSSSGKKKSSNISAPLNDAENQIPLCNCNIAAVQLTVRKDGPNTGRKFYKCNNNGGCDFFMWADGILPKGNKPLSSRQHQIDIRGNNSSQVLCRCGIPVVQRTVQKNGSHQGRSFNSCRKSRHEQCGFFEWVDSSVIDSQSFPLSSDINECSQGNHANSTSLRSRKPPTCSICHEVGHTKRGCPHK